MRKAERARYVEQKLSELYPSPPIPLQHHSHFTLIVAVLLSAQCTDERVNRVTPELFSLADTPEKMRLQPVEKVHEIIRSCGLAPQKSKAIVALSKIVCDKHGGKMPDSIEDLEELPGVGHKTASVVMCQAFNKPALPVDTHIHRVARRWGLSNGTSVARTERDLKKLFPRESWCALHLRMIYYGREHCTARGCRGLRCPICIACYPKRKIPA